VPKREEMTSLGLRRPRGSSLSYTTEEVQRYFSYSTSAEEFYIIVINHSW
jgi:hypothetical protein